MSFLYANYFQTAPTLQMLGDDATDDTNTFFQSAYACGRRIIVTDFGKQMMLKVQNPNPNAVTLPSVANTVHARNGDVKQTKPHMNVLIPNSTGQKLVAKSNILKRISSEELTKLVSDGKFASVGNPSSAAITNGSIRFPKYRLTSLAKVSNVSIYILHIIFYFLSIFIYFAFLASFSRRTICLTRHR